MREQDVEDIVEMRKKSTKDFRDGPDVPTSEQLMEALQEYPKRNILHLVAEMQGKVVEELILNEDHPPDASANFLWKIASAATYLNNSLRKFLVQPKLFPKEEKRILIVLKAP